MNGEERRRAIVNYIGDSEKPVSGTKLAQKFQVSRQVIVQDIALLRAADVEILSTHRGYVLADTKKTERVFPVFHTDDEMEAELNTVVDLGGTVVDVFVRHEIYGELRAALNISSRREVQHFLDDIQRGDSKPLTNLTSGHHCHTVRAVSEEILDEIQDALGKLGILEKGESK